MKKTIKLTERDLNKLIKRVISEQGMGLNTQSGPPSNNTEENRTGMPKPCPNSIFKNETSGRNWSIEFNTTRRGVSLIKVLDIPDNRVYSFLKNVGCYVKNERIKINGDNLGV